MLLDHPGANGTLALWYPKIFEVWALLWVNQAILKRLLACQRIERNPHVTGNLERDETSVQRPLVKSNEMKTNILFLIFTGVPFAWYHLHRGDLST